MALADIALTDVRLFDQLTLPLGDGINVITGPNGSGKSTVLEAAHLLGTGRSFRTQDFETLRRSGARSMVVRGTVVRDEGNVSVGIDATQGQRTRIRIDGENATSASELARLLPIQLLTPDSLQLITGAPQLRRKLLDLGTYHRFADYGAKTRRYRLALQQLNELLRAPKVDASERAGWERETATAGEAVAADRETFFTEWQEALAEDQAEWQEALPLVRALSLSLERGWSKSQSLQEALAANHSGDRITKHVRSGPHAADIRLTIDHNVARWHVSRGEAKLLAAFVSFSLGRYLSMSQGTDMVYLVDDVAAELDPQSLDIAAKMMENTGGQVLCSALQESVATRLTRRENIHLLPLVA